MGDPSHAPIFLPSGKPTVHIRCLWKGSSVGMDGLWRRKNFFTPPEIEPSTVHTLATNYADYTISTPFEGQLVLQPQYQVVLLDDENQDNTRFKTFAVFWMLYAFFWVIPRRLDFICRLYGTLFMFHLDTYLLMKMEQTECSEMSAYKIQMRRNYPEESLQQDNTIFR